MAEVKKDATNQSGVPVPQEAARAPLPKKLCMECKLPLLQSELELGFCARCWWRQT